MGIMKGRGVLGDRRIEGEGDLERGDRQEGGGRKRCRIVNSVARFPEILLS